MNSFDQWGVELGKELATGLLPVVEGKQSAEGHDPPPPASSRPCSGPPDRAPDGARLDGRAAVAGVRLPRNSCAQALQL
ncbi:hypothetical protein [Thauera sp. SDU_THAU2]|uniref:hypothetical protein n=1 Tax=Thauera sp. SDU_THAU2 TaxID=3136633 RepID=UPI004054AC43